MKDEIIKDMVRIREENENLTTQVKQLNVKLKKLGTEKKVLSEELSKFNVSRVYRKNQEYKKSLSEALNECENISKDLKREQAKNCDLKGDIKQLKDQIKKEQSLKSYYQSSLSKEKEIKLELNKMLSFDGNSKNVHLREDKSHRYSDDVSKTLCLTGRSKCLCD